MIPDILPRIGNKGVGPIAIAIVLVAGVLAAEGVFVTNFVANSEVIKRSAREVGIIDAINKLELSKRYLQNALGYSFYEASYEIFNMGGFCASNSDGCIGECKIPESVPSSDCIPWWIVYGDVYAPEYESTDDTKGFVDYISERVLSIFSSYSYPSDISYCPGDGNVSIESGGETVNIGVMNMNGDLIEYSDSDLNIAERTTNFTTSVYSYVPGMFQYARYIFVEDDGIGAAFDTAVSGMGENCLHGYVGDVCAISVEEACESYLESSCYQMDDGSGCDFDSDGIITADEKYRCLIEEEFNDFSYEDAFIAPISVECMNAGHTYDADYTEISVDWEEYSSAIQSGGYAAMAVQSECNALSGCGCADLCEKGEGCSIPQCNSDGTCPSQSEIDAACGSGGCGYYSSCVQGCQEYECDYSEDNPCEVIVACEGTCYLDGCQCLPTPECLYYGFCDCTPVIEETYDCENECCQGGQTCVEYGCDFIWTCNENTCGNTCCQSMNTLYQDLNCTFDYSGSATVLVEVEDPINEYPIGSSWEKMKLSFLITDGNAQGCIGNSTEENELCCPVVTTEDSSCKV